MSATTQQITAQVPIAQSTNVQLALVLANAMQLALTQLAQVLTAHSQTAVSARCIRHA